MRSLQVLYRIIGVFPGYFWRAESPADFWTKWNPEVHGCFAGTYRRLLKRQYRKTGHGFGKSTQGIYILTTFVVMGTLHDLFIYLTASDEFPLFSTAYFCLNGVLVLLEAQCGLRLAWGPWYVRRATTLVVVIATLVAAHYIAPW